MYIIAAVHDGGSYEHELDALVLTERVYWDHAEENVLSITPEKTLT